MLTAMVSAYSRRRVKNQLAMTGEITLHGKVLPVGGIKEKILAAKRAGINEIVMSKRNQTDIEEIEEHYIKGMKFHFVERASEVLKLALVKEQDKTAKPLEIQDVNQKRNSDKEIKKIRVIPNTPPKGKSGSVGV
jgi:ATP-dependent Lon protease